MKTESEFDVDDGAAEVIDSVLCLHQRREACVYNLKQASQWHKSAD